MKVESDSVINKKEIQYGGTLHVRQCSKGSDLTGKEDQVDHLRISRKVWVESTEEERPIENTETIWTVPKRGK